MQIDDRVAPVAMEAIMMKLVRSAAVGTCLAIAVAGCATPVPPQGVSALLPKHAALYAEDWSACDEADALVVSQCTQVEEYDSIIKGNWVEHWYRTEWRVIRVERGEWPEETISFVFRDRGSPSQSGFYLGKAPQVYYRGAVVGFCLDTSKSTPVIVTQQARSRLPSHGSLRCPRYDAREPGREQMFQNVIEAARRFVQLPFGGSLAVTEEYDTFFVVEVTTPDDSAALKVEKNSYRVTQIPDPYIEVGPSDAGV